MTQTVVNFITSITPPVGSTTLPSQSRVFDFEISEGAQDYYTYLIQQMQILYATISQSTDSVNNHTAEMKQFAQYLAALNDWTQMKYIDTDGVQKENTFSDPGGVLTNPSGFTGDATMTNDMAQALNQLNGLFTTVDLQTISDPSQDFIHKTQAQIIALGSGSTTLTRGVLALRLIHDNPTVYNIDSLFTKALNAAANARIFDNAFTGSKSIQEALAVDYVSRGNEILFNEMDLLNKALNANRAVLGYLNSLQDLMNQKDPQQFIKQLQYLDDGTSQLEDSDYNDYEQNTYNQTLGSDSEFGNSSDVQTQGDIDALYYAAYTDPTTADTSFTISRIQSILTNLINYVNETSGAGTPGQPAPGTQLTLALQAIRNDFDQASSELAALPSASHILEAWIEDIQASGGQGSYQTHINNAVSAAQSFNDVQREKLSNVMFVFQEFYQSASSLLSNINQLIQKMASNMAR